MGALKDIALMIKDAMKNAGVDAIPNPMDFNSLYNNASSHTFDAMLGGWSGGSGYSDPTQLWSTESWANMGSNFCGFGDAYSDSLIVAANTSLTPQKHQEAYFALQRYIYQQQPYVFLWSEMQPMAIHKRFKDQTFFSVRPNINIGSLQFRE
jgi:peptide/nickel transport system substrate-binding protein